MPIENGRLVADLILENGNILTVDPHDTVAHSVAVVGDRIVAVGTNQNIDELKGSSATRRIDLTGSTVIPGMIDNHTRPIFGGLWSSEAGAKVDVAWSQSIADIKDKIGEAARQTPDGEWISGSLIYLGGALKEGRFPDKNDLDEASPNNPAYIMVGGGSFIVNSRALELAGITRDTPDPGDDPNDPEGHIVRDAVGEPTGTLLFGAADVARKRWWGQLGQRPRKWEFLRYGHDANVAALRAAMRRFNAVGVTGTRDMGLDAEEIDAYVDLVSRGEATVRTDLLIGLPARYLSIDEVESALKAYLGPKQGFGGDWLRIGGLKMVVGAFGWWFLSPEKMQRMVRVSNQLGWTLAIHGFPGDVGDSIELLLDTLEEADRERPIAGRRFSYEHGMGVLNPAHYNRLLKLGFIMAANPLMTYYLAAGWAKMHKMINELRIQKAPVEVDPEEHARRAWGLPMRSWIDAGLVVTGGTDFPAVDYELERPMLGFWSACTQQSLLGEMLPGEKITRSEALRMWTINGAFATFQEHEKGSIEPGKLADFVVLSADPLTVDDDDLLGIRVLETIVGGKTVYER